MNICNHCGAEVGVNRYGSQSTLCRECLQTLTEDYHEQPPADDMDPPRRESPEARVTWRDMIGVMSQIGGWAALLLLALAIGLALGATLAFVLQP